MSFIQADGWWVAICEWRKVFCCRWILKTLLQSSFEGCRATIFNNVTVVIKGILLADIGRVNELRWLLNCVSHDPLHEREREIHCSAPASLTFPFSHRAFSLFHSNPPAVSVRSQERHGGPKWGWVAGSCRDRGRRRRNRARPHEILGLDFPRAEHPCHGGRH